MLRSSLGRQINGFATGIYISADADAGASSWRSGFRAVFSQVEPFRGLSLQWQAKLDRSRLGGERKNLAVEPRYTQGAGTHIIRGRGTVLASYRHFTFIHILPEQWSGSTG